MPTLILLSSEFPPGPGGIGNHAYHLAAQLHARGWDIRVISPQDYVSDEEVDSFNRLQPFPVIRLSSGGGWLREGISRFLVLRGPIREGKADLLLASGKSAVLLGALASRLSGLRFAAVGHGREFTARGFWLRTVTRWAYQQADAIIGVSHFTWGLIGKLGVKPRAGKVIQNAADHRRFDRLPVDGDPSWRKQMGLEKSNILLTVGSVTDRKGQEVVIRALPEILKIFPDTHYLMAGIPIEQQKLGRLAGELGVADHTHFLGRVSDADLVGYLNCCDLFLMTSRFTEDGDCEGFGIAAVEAALCGKPAIVSGNSGLSEAIINGKTGIEVPEGDAGATAQAVLRLLRDPGLGKAMGEAAYFHSRNLQTWEIKGGEYDCFLRDLLASASPRG